MTDNEQFERWWKEREYDIMPLLGPKQNYKYVYLAGCEMERWQPIETAPKDETVILIALPPVGVLKDEGARRVYEGRWSTIQSMFTSVNGFIVLDIATHWMPLPAPPRINKGDNQ